MVTSDLRKAPPPGAVVWGRDVVPQRDDGQSSSRRQRQHPGQSYPQQVSRPPSLGSRDRGRVVDNVVAALVVVLAQLDVWTPALRTELTGPRWLAFLVLTSLGPILLLRRRRPLLTALLICALSGAWWIVERVPPIATSATVAVMIASYSLGRWEPRRRRALIGLTVIGTALAAHLLLNPGTRTWEAARDELPWTLVVIVLWLLGAYLRYRSLYIEGLRRAAVQEERARIAREMHDVVAHGLGVMVIQAEAAEEMVSVGNPDQARSCLQKVQTTGRLALEDLRSTLSALRDDRDPEWHPQPSLSGLDALVESVRAAGLAVELSVIGMPRPVTPQVGLVAYRLIQEALTNTIKHSCGGTATVTLTYETDQVVIHVRDRGPRRAPHRVEIGTGSGLIGMEERVAAVRGQVESGPDGDGGFRVRARIPAAGP